MQSQSHHTRRLSLGECQRVDRNMDSNFHCSHESCDGCSVQHVCYCLKITEEVLTEAVTRFGLQTLDEVRRLTGAGDGCTACHQRIRQLLEEAAQPSSSSPIFSVR